jgi:hypothetical protein
LNFKNRWEWRKNALECRACEKEAMTRANKHGRDVYEKFSEQIIFLHMP